MATSDKSKKTRLKEQLRSSASFSVARLAVFVSVFALIAATVIIHSYAEPKSRGVNLYINPADQKVSSGDNLSVQVWLDARDQPINAVQANLSYPTDKLDFSSVDGMGSAFEVEAQSSGGNGLVKIARGHVGNVTGVQLVATVNFKSKSSSGKANIDFTAGSAAVRSTDNVNVLQSTSGGRYSMASLFSSGTLSNNVFKVDSQLVNSLHRP